MEWELSVTEVKCLLDSLKRQLLYFGSINENDEFIPNRTYPLAFLLELGVISELFSKLYFKNRCMKKTTKLGLSLANAVVLLRNLQWSLEVVAGELPLVHHGLRDKLHQKLTSWQSEIDLSEFFHTTPAVTSPISPSQPAQLNTRALAEYENQLKSNTSQP